MKFLSCVSPLIACAYVLSPMAWADSSIMNNHFPSQTLHTQTTPPSLPASKFQTSLLSAKKNNNVHKDKIELEEGEDVQYAVFRGNGDIYFKGRAGYLTDYTEESFEDISIEEIIDSFDENGALGIGAGYTLKSGNKLEFEYTVTKRSEQILQIEYLF